MSDAWLETLSDEECHAHLREEIVGRMGVVVDDLPTILPVNYRLVDANNIDWLLVRTRRGNVLDRASRHVAFEIDGVDRTHRRGWSVLVRGTLFHLIGELAETDGLLDSNSWLSEQRDSWLAVYPNAVTGRRLQSLTIEWAFRQSAYL